jgi:hypothetical protein
MPAEAVLHALELGDALDALWLGLAKDEAGEGQLELFAARPVGHAAQARTVPVDRVGLGIEGRLLRGFGFESLQWL